MLKAVSNIVAKLSPHARKDMPPDPLVAKMRSLSWAPTEDDRSALRYEIESEQGVALAEKMASSYLGRPTEPFE